jgi:hypothetical protein
MSSFLPSGIAPISTSMHSAVVLHASLQEDGSKARSPECARHSGFTTAMYGALQKA